MGTKTRAAILTVGTELTTGELLNTNATWLSTQLEKLQLDVYAHLTVADDREDILGALTFLENHCSLLFVTGGLGPTKDDFTRDLIAEWSQKTLVLDEKSLQTLKDKFAKMNRTFYSFQEQQSYFPKNSQVLANHRGTADAFYLQKDHVQTWVLPGPPSEVEAIWHKYVLPQLQLMNLSPKKEVLKTWLCFGEGESVIANLTEEVVAGLPFTTGYRHHHPYVEVKVWGKPNDFSAHDELSELTDKLAKYSISREKKTLSSQLFDLLSDKYNYKFFEGLDSGNLSLKYSDYLLSQINPLSLDVKFEKSWKTQSAEQLAQKNFEEDFCFFVLSVTNAGNEFECGIITRGQKVFSERIAYPRKSRRSQTAQLWAIEKACQVWSSWLQKNTNIKLV